MWTVIYLDREDNVARKGGFKSDADAFAFVLRNKGQIHPLSINVWSEYSQTLRAVYKVKNGRWEVLE